MDLSLHIFGDLGAGLATVHLNISANPREGPGSWEGCSKNPGSVPRD